MANFMPGTPKSSIDIGHQDTKIVQKNLYKRTVRAYLNGFPKMAVLDREFPNVRDH
jgi:hypothetical protein